MKTYLFLFIAFCLCCSVTTQAQRSAKASSSPTTERDRSMIEGARDTLNTRDTHDSRSPFVLIFTLEQPADGKGLSLHNSASSSATVSNPSGVGLDLEFWLEGAFDPDAGSMSTHMYDNESLPLAQPFNVSPWFYDGDETLDPDMPNLDADANRPVDWVLVTVQKTSITIDTDGKEVETIVGEETKAGILTKDGDLLRDQSVEDQFPIYFDVLDNATTYNVIVRHRSHLDVIVKMKWNEPVFDGFLVSHNLRVPFPSWSVLGTPDVFFLPFLEEYVVEYKQLKKLADTGDRYGLHAGDFRPDGVIQNTDDCKWKFFLENYLATDTWFYFDTDSGLGEDDWISISVDANMDGTIDTVDFDLWYDNRAKMGHPAIQLP